MTVSGLSGRRVLIVEDDPIIAMLLEDMMQGLGVEVAAQAETVEEAKAAALRDGFDAAILDVNLHGKMSYPVAELLARRGVPIVLVSGYARDRAPDSLRHAPLVPKPYQAQQIAEALARVLGLRDAR